MIYRFDEVFPLYKRVVAEYESEISKYGFETLEISDTERVYVVQEKFVVYLGMVDFCIHLNDDDPTYMIVFEEMMKNTVFKFNFAGFKRNFTTNEGLMMEYKKFHGWGKPIREINDITLGNYQRFNPSYTAAKYFIPSKCEFINEKFPELNIKELYENLEGDPYFYLLLRVLYKGRPGYAIQASKKKFSEKKIREAVYTALYEGLNYAFRKDNMDANKLGSDQDFSAAYYEAADIGSIAPRFDELNCDSRMVDCFYESIWNDSDNAGANYKNEAYFTIDSYVISKNFREPEEAKQAIGGVFLKTRTGAYDGFFSPEIIFNADAYRASYIIEKILRTEYKDLKKDYEAPYLKYNGEQYSYEFFIPKKKVAVIYRSRANFEPIEEFGGEEKMAEVQEHDRTLAALSAENGIKIAYINYTDTISLELLKERIENAGTEVMPDFSATQDSNSDDGISFVLPKYYQQLESLPEDPKYSSSYGYTLPEMQSFVMAYPINNKDAMPYEKDEMIVYKIREYMQEDQGLIEVKNGRTVHGKKYVYTIVKSKKEPSGVLYTLTLHVSYDEFTLAIQGYFEELGITGTRDTIIREQLIREKVVNPYDMSTWAKDPYVSHIKTGFLMNMSENEKYDEMFPNHPLSQLRSLTKFIISNN